MDNAPQLPSYPKNIITEVPNNYNVIFFLPVDHPFPEETVLSLSLVKSGRDSKLFKKGCALKRSKSNADKGNLLRLGVLSKNISKSSVIDNDDNGISALGFDQCP